MGKECVCVCVCESECACTKDTHAETEWTNVGIHFSFLSLDLAGTQVAFFVWSDSLNALFREKYLIKILYK